MDVHAVVQQCSALHDVNLGTTPCSLPVTPCVTHTPLHITHRVLKGPAAEVELAALAVGQGDGWEVAQVGRHGAHAVERNTQGNAVPVEGDSALVQVDAAADDVTCAARL